MNKPTICTYGEYHGEYCTFYDDPINQSCVDCLLEHAEEIIKYLKWLKEQNFDKISFNKEK